MKKFLSNLGKKLHLTKKKLIIIGASVGGVAAVSAGVIIPIALSKPNLKSNVTTYSFPGTGYMGNDYFAIKSPVVRVSPGSTKQIAYESYPLDYAIKNVTFTSKNTSIATVSSTGVITGVAKGVVDISVDTLDGESLGKVRVAVSDPNPAANKEVKDAISEAYQTSEAPTKAIQYEYSFEKYNREGELVHGSESVEIMAYDANEGYFYIEGPYLNYKTRKGVPDISDGKWLFYTINSGLKTRLIHITSNAKRYWDLNTATYASNDAIIKDILNFFFVSGEKILNDFLDNYYGKEEFLELAAFSSTKFYGVNSNSLYYTFHQQTEEVTDAEDEISYMDIPAETPYTSVLDLEALNEGTRITGYCINATYSYEYEDAHWTREFVRNKLFDDDFEIVKVKDPDKNGYKAVDSIYDL